MSETKILPTNMLPEDLPNHGFEVHMLPHQPEAVPADQVLADLTEIRTAFVRRYHERDGVRVVEAGEPLNPGEKEKHLTARLEVPRDKYEQGVQEGRLLPSLHSFTGRPVSNLNPEQAAENHVPDYFPTEVMEAIEKAIPRAALGMSDADYSLLDGSLLDRLKTVHQVFEYQAGNVIRRLYNFSDTPVSEAVLKKMTNGLREQNDRTGGAAMEAVSVMAIVPENDPYWTPADDIREGLIINARTSGLGAMVINERVIKDEYDEQREQQYEEGAQGVSGGVEVIVSHEAQHALASKGKDPNAHKAFGEAVGWEYETDQWGRIVSKSKHTFTGDTVHPSEYGSPW